MLVAAGDAERPRLLLEEILARPEFHAATEGRSDWLEEILDRLFGLLGETPAPIGQLLTAGVVVLAILLVVHLLVEGGTFRRRGAEAEGDDLAEAPASVSSLALFHAGREAMNEGRLSEAVLLLFRAIVARLVERGFLLADPSRTNREHLRDLRARPKEASALSRAVPAFERVRYGERPAAPEEAQLVWAAASGFFPEEER